MEKIRKRGFYRATVDRLPQVQELRLQGHTNKEIAKKIFVCVNTIEEDFNRLRKQGINIKPPKRETPETRARRKLVKKLYKKHTAIEIAEITGESINRIKNDIKENNKLLKKQKEASTKESNRRERVAQKLKNGESPDQIAEAEGVSISKINADIFIIENQVADPKVLHDFIAKRLKK